MDKIRIPTAWILKMAEDLRNHPDQLYWEFESYYGNQLVGNRVRGADDKGLAYDSIDFEWNPGD